MITASSLLIDHETLAIKPHFQEQYRSKIVKTDGYHYTEFTPYELLDERCVHFGSTLKGRQDAASRKLGIYKSPVIVEPGKLGFFPTTSISNPDCIWISDRAFSIVNPTENQDKNKSILMYQPNIFIEVNTSKWTITKQYERLQALLYVP